MLLFDYNKSDKRSILEYSKLLLGKTLEEAIAPKVIKSRKGKGSLGQLVEEYFFGYDVNSNPDADFMEAGLELKVTPLKALKNKALAIKERLVCTMIDYDEVQRVPFEKSHIYLKCAFMLILFYLHKADVPVQQLVFIYSVLWQIPDKDLLIMKHDYETIVSKIRAGKAHELSEGDTVYLGACRKGQKGDANVNYTLWNGTRAEIPAPKRAFSLKTQYMRTILDFAKKTGGRGTYNASALVHGYKAQLVDESELHEKSFEEILLDRFKPFYGMTYSQLVEALNIKDSVAKSKYFLVANEILTECHKRGEDVTKEEEFRKSGIVIKTIRLGKSGRPAEAMSFENINYFDILEEEDWFESRLYEIFTGRFLFIVFQEDENSEIRLKKAFFWTMPADDLNEAALYWLNIKNAVMNNRISPESFYRESDHKKFHVRPKGRNASDMTVNPNGGTAKKYCYWFNHDYIKSIVAKAE
jgi:DNA mismatch repair protein MutH